MFTIIKYGLAAYGGYMLYRQYIVKDIGKVAIKGKGMQTFADCSDPSLTFNQKEMCKERNNPGYIHAPLQAQTMASWTDVLEEGHLKKLITVGGVIAAVIGTSYLIKAYLDILRIKMVKEELKAMKSKTKPIMNSKQEENWILEDD